MPVLQSHRHKIIAAAVISTLLLIYTLAGFLGVPKLARHLAQNYIAERGLTLEVSALHFNPFTFETRISQARVAEPDGDLLLGFDDLYVNLGVLSSIRHRAVALQAIHWTAPDIAVVLDANGQLNLLQLAPPVDDSDEPTPAGSPPRIRIGELSVQQGRIQVEDRKRPEPFRIELSPISFGLADFSTAIDHRNAYTFHGVAASGEELEWSGDFTVQPLGANGQFALRNLQARTLADYLQDQLPLRLRSGVAELQGEYRVALESELMLDLLLPEIVVRDFAVSARNTDKDATPPVALGELRIHHTQVSLAEKTVGVERVELRQLRVSARRTADGRLDLADLYAAAPAADDTDDSQDASSIVEATDAQASADDAAWRVRVKHFSVADSAVQLQDESVTPSAQITVAPITIDVREIDTAADARPTLTAQLGINESGRLQIEGGAQLQPIAATLQLQLEGVALSALQPYLNEATGITLQSGSFDGQGKLQIGLDDTDAVRLQFNGEAGIRDLAVVDRAQKQSLLGWRDLRVRDIAFDNQPLSIEIGRIDLSAPDARVEIAEDRQINIARALAPPAATPTEETEGERANAADDSTLPLRIGSIHVADGRMRFTDQSIQPRFSAGIVELGGSITGLAMDATSRSRIQLAGKVDEYAPVSIEGEIIPAAFGTHTDIALRFRNIDLIRFNPYSGRFAGYNITKGKLTTELHYRISDRQLQAEHHVVLDQLEFGEATGSKDAIPLPLKLAVALMKDRRGIIDLELPVRGSLDDPSFRVGPLVWKAVVNVLTKAVTAPFALLGSIAGGGDELAYVDFDPGSAELRDSEREKLQKLASALVERPQLRLDIPVTRAPDIDGAALAQQALDARMPVAAEGDDAEKTLSARLDALETLYRELFDQRPDYPETIGELERDARPAARVTYLEPLLLKRLQPEAQALTMLAVARARAVQSAILSDTGVDAERTFLTRREAAGRGEAGAVRMELSLR